jgi:hypothetical protein
VFLSPSLQTAKADPLAWGATRMLFPIHLATLRTRLRWFRVPASLVLSENTGTRIRFIFLRSYIFFWILFFLFPRYSENKKTRVAYRLAVRGPVSPPASASHLLRAHEGTEGTTLGPGCSFHCGYNLGLRVGLLTSLVKLQRCEVVKDGCAHAVLIFVLLQRAKGNGPRLGIKTEYRLFEVLALPLLAADRPIALGALQD